METKPEWVKIKPAEVESLILELHKEGKTPAQIGLILRDKHGVPKTKIVANKRISEILIENKKTISPEKNALQKKMTSLNTHIEKHHHDYCAKKSIAKKQWIMNKLSKE